MGLEERTAHAGPRPERPHARADWRQMLGIGVIASILGIIAGLLIDWFPVAASGQAKPIDTLWDVLLIASIPVFVMVQVIVLFSVWKFRMRPGEELLDGPPIHGNTRLEVDLDGDPGDPAGRPVHVRLRRARGRREGRGRLGDAERARRGRAVRVDLLLRAATARRSRRASCTCRSTAPVQVHAPVQGRAARLLGAGLPDEEGRGAGDRRDLSRDAEPHRLLPDRVRRAVRARALGDARRGGRGVHRGGLQRVARERRAARAGDRRRRRRRRRRGDRRQGDLHLQEAAAPPATRWPTRARPPRPARTSTRCSPTRTRPSSRSRSSTRTR